MNKNFFPTLFTRFRVLAWKTSNCMKTALNFQSPVCPQILMVLGHRAASHAWDPFFIKVILLVTEFQNTACAVNEQKFCNVLNNAN